MHEMKPCGRRAGWVGRSGKNGAAAIGAAWLKPKMRCFKLLGEGIMARDFDCRVAELQVRAAVLNGFTRLGTPVTVPVLSNLLQIASARPSLHYAQQSLETVQGRQPSAGTSVN
jgi:hypothetical protein